MKNKEIAKRIEIERRMKLQQDSQKKIQKQINLLQDDDALGVLNVDLKREDLSSNLIHNIDAIESNNNNAMNLDHSIAKSVVLDNINHHLHYHYLVAAVVVDDDDYVYHVSRLMLI